MYDLHYSFIFWIAWHHLESNVVLTQRQLSNNKIDTPLIVGKPLWICGHIHVSELIYNTFSRLSEKNPNLTYSRMSITYRLWIVIAIRRVYVFCASNFHLFLIFFLTFLWKDKLYYFWLCLFFLLVQPYFVFAKTNYFAIYRFDIFCTVYYSVFVFKFHAVKLTNFLCNSYLRYFY